MKKNKKKKPMVEEARSAAETVLAHCIHPIGFYASGLPKGYEALWARDSMITALGASIIGKPFQTAIKRSITTLSRHQSTLGQIPNAVGTYNIDRRSSVTYNTIDSNLWYLIGHYVYRKGYGDRSLTDRYKKNIDTALTWLKYQDPNEVKLLAQQPTMDWQDAFPHKYGHTINTHALYYAALKMWGEQETARHIRRVVNGDIEKYLSLYDHKRGHYLPWLWKNHDGDREEEHWFDTLGNVLAIVTGLASKPIAKRILNHIEKKGINHPYPCKAIYPPIKRGDKEWRSYFSKAISKTPYVYINAGVWPFIGGFYVAALVKIGAYAKAKQELEKLAEANRLRHPSTHAKRVGAPTNWGFSEWLHGRTGRVEELSTPYQAWSAGMYIFAHECVRRRRVPYFT